MPLVRFVHCYPIRLRPACNEDGTPVLKENGRQALEVVPSHPARPARDYEVGGWWEMVEDGDAR